MDDMDDSLGAVFTALAIAFFVLLFVMITVVAWLTVWAVRTRRKNPTLVFLLAFVGVLSAEIAGVVAFMVIKDDTDSSWAVLLFGALSVASFVAVAKRPIRPAEPAA